MTCRRKRKCNILPTLRVPGNTPYIGGPLVRTGIPFIDDLVFDFDTRLDLNLVDNIAGELAPIQDFVAGAYDGVTSVSDYGAVGAGVFDINTDKTFRINIRTGGDVTAFQPIFSTGAGGGGDGYMITVRNGMFRLEVAKGLVRPTIDLGVSVINTEYEIVVSYNSATQIAILWIDGVNVGNLDYSILVAPIVYLTNFTLALIVATFGELDLWDLRVYTGVKTAANIVANPLTDLIHWSPDVYSGIDVVAANHATLTDLTKAYQNTQPYLFTDGFTQYWDVATGLVSLQLPYSLAGVPIVATPFVHDGNNYALSEAHPYNAFHNLAECFIDFNPTNSGLAKFNIFDRSNALVFNATARVAAPLGFYNAAEPWTFHISELSQFVLAGYYVVGQRRKTYTQGTNQSILQAARLNLDRIFVYGTDKINNNDIAVLTFTNDIVQVVTDGGGNYIFDVNGYAVLINT